MSATRAVLVSKKLRSVFFIFFLFLFNESINYNNVTLVESDFHRTIPATRLVRVFQTEPLKIVFFFFFRGEPANPFDWPEKIRVVIERKFIIPETVTDGYDNYSAGIFMVFYVSVPNTGAVLGQYWVLVLWERMRTFPYPTQSSRE